MSIQDEIVAYAQQRGLDPAYALAVASRESSFDPNARASKTIYGLFQMSGAERARLGIPYTPDIGTQVRGFATYTNELKDQMTHFLGREPSPSEMYLGHYWGPGRAAGVINGRYSGLAARDVFTSRELAENPNLKPDKPVGEIAANIQADMARRYAKYGGEGSPNSAGGTPVDDPSIYLTPSGDTAGNTMMKAAKTVPSAPAPSMPSASEHVPSPSDEDSAATAAALKDGDDGFKPLADLASNVGNAMSAKGAAPAVQQQQPQQPDLSDLYRHMAQMQIGNTPVSGLPGLPGAQAQPTPDLPGSSQQPPPYLDQRMFGIQTQQG